MFPSARLDAVHHLLACSIVRESSGQMHCGSYILGFGLKRIYFSKVVLTPKGPDRDRKGIRVPGMRSALILADWGRKVREVAWPKAP